MSAEGKDPFGTTSCKLFKAFQYDLGRLQAISDTHPFGFATSQMYRAMVEHTQDQLKDDLRHARYGQRTTKAP